MLIAKVAFPTVGAVLLLASLVSTAARKGREEQEDGYFEQCRFVNAWKERLLGHVSVLAFLDPAWQYSFRQAVMLEMLSSRLRKSGFPDIRFFVISPSPGSTENESSEDELEIEAWRDIGAKHSEMDSFADDFLRVNETKITFLQDDSRSRIWEKFRASRDQMIIIDRCGKLTYHVIVPWSILFFPYVKAAILSTYKEDPCGGCNFQPDVYHEDHVVKLTKDTDEVEESTLQRETDTSDKFEAITENLENSTLHHDESEEKRETSTTASSTFLEEITSDIDHSNLSTESSTESTTHRYDSDATESRFDEDYSNAEATWMDQEDSMTEDFSEIAVTLEPQSLPPEQTRGTSRPLMNNNSTISTYHGNTADRALLLDEPTVTESDSTSAEETMTTLNIVDKIRDENITPEGIDSFKKDTFLRIIMYAPHVHKNGNKTKKYTHLILKTGNPDFHGHLDSGVDVASPDSWPDVNSPIASSEDYDWRTTETDEADEENTNQQYMFDKDESPGLYGEVADYWKSEYEDNDITDRNETSSDIYDNATINYNEEHRINVSDQAICPSPPEGSPANITEDPNIESSTDPQSIVGTNTIEPSKPINTNDQVDSEEERNKLIEHYSKLLSWVDYELSK
ncbi:uncharacterized protein LOC105833090 [Monomorium pharaonis]|uniref:uncharacterized protein LOC105833090 n=1 Tax=Monomorium pharaonis TaxID=307658 RepID=UPI00063F2030|nr:uncharacterized protein LOC105833090 [Monomorium pharaonis]